MKLQIGRQVPGEGSVEASLADCHKRIRHFCDVACRLAAAAGDPAQRAGVTQDEVAQVARGVARYFGEALPLHEADEEQSLRPRLGARDAEVDAALELMHLQHERLHDPTRRLIALASTLSEQPELLEDPATAAALEDAAGELSAGFAEHLDLEERVILPAIGSLLDDQERSAVREEMRSRRD